jgi:hypothetical protein
MVAHLTVVDKWLSQWALPCSCSQLLLIACGNCGDNAWSCSGNVNREMTTIRPWIADQFVPFIECLRDIKSLLGTKAKQPIRMPLQLGEVVKQGWLHPLRLGRE